MKPRGWRGESQRHSMAARGVVSDFNKHTQWMQDAKAKQEEWRLKAMEHDAHRRTVIKTGLWDQTIPELRSVQSVDVQSSEYADGTKFNRFTAEITFDGQIKHGKIISSDALEDLEAVEGKYFFIEAAPKQLGLRMFVTFHITGDVRAIPDIKKKVKSLYRELRT